MEWAPLTQSGNAGRTSLHYRAYLPVGISVVVAVVVASVLLPLYWLAPSYLTSSTVVVVSILVTNVILKRDVVLSSDGRLTVTGLGQHIDVDVRCLTEISVSAVARGGFGLARVRWNGGGFRMWQAVIYLPDPRHRGSARAESPESSLRTSGTWCTAYI
nr:hypothetical protein GCM10010200_048570 [Actinomadura rugatobispora]